jgi:type IV pilus assembly protein PilY1
MSARTRLPKVLAPLALLALLAAAPARAQDDTALFSTAVPPNVLLFVDNSGSMNEVMWHPSYQRSAPGACPIFGLVAPNAGGPTSGSSTINNMSYTCSQGLCRVQIGSGTSGFTSTGTVTCPSGATRQKGYISRTFCSNTRRMYVDAETACQGNSTWYSEEYLEWYFSDVADPYFLGTETNTSTDITKIDANQNGTHYINNQKFPLYKRSRITAAKEIARDVIYQVNSNCTQGGGFPCPAGGKDVVRFGVGRFDGTTTTPGGFVNSPVNDYTANAVALDNAIGALDAETSTPLAESLFKVYTYFMSRVDTQLPFGKDGVTRFPKYQYNTTDGNATATPPADPLVCPGSGAKCSCQKSFVIMLTDGFPTNDDFALASPRTAGFADFTDRLIGDYNAGDEVEVPGGAAASSLYLDDVAKFMQDNDFRPDIPEKQVIDVYTVGLATEGATNALLEKTAAMGNGQFFTGTQAQDLTDALVSAINSILLKSQAFTAATVPATRTAFGGKFYNSLFVPSQESGYWEGHLQSWEITAAGEIRDASGQCAFDGSPVPCLEGVFDPNAQPYWDAADGVPSPAGRSLFTSVNGVRRDFTDSQLDETHLALTAPEIAFYSYEPPAAPAANVGELADMVVWNVRGCKMGTGVGGVPCEPRTDRVGNPHLLGDIFHSNPVVVPRPQGYLPEPSYQQWASPATNPAVGLRKQVIVAGANDGLFRIVDAGDWDPSPAVGPPRYEDDGGAELAGFMPYTARQRVKYLARDGGTRDWYFTDGSPAVADVWLYDDPQDSDPANKDMDEWHTVAISGMRQGGNQYFALDITNPADSGYPGYLWEFPYEGAPAALTEPMGQTWSEPVITRVKLAVNGNYASPQERWVAVFGGGFDPTGDPNGGTYVATARAGRAIRMVDIRSGELVAEKRFLLPTDPGYSASDPQAQMLYAVASTPGVYDVDFDGYADVVYVGDLGGNVWKWVIRNVGDDVVNGGTGSLGQANWHFEKFFSAPVCGVLEGCVVPHYRSFFFNPSATLRNGVLWLAFGSGERTDLEFPGIANADENNRFYAVKDLDPLAKSLATPPQSLPLGESTLLDITGDSSCADVGSNDGFFFEVADGEKFVTATDIFFYYVFAATFTPEVNTDPCAAAGRATLYAFKVYCGEGLFEDAGGNPITTIDLGDGMPTDPKVSLSGEEGGSRVFINKKDEVLSKDTGFNLDDSTGQAYWRELHN